MIQKHHYLVLVKQSLSSNITIYIQQFIGINVDFICTRIFETLGAGSDASMIQTVVMGLVNGIH